MPPAPPPYAIVIRSQSFAISCGEITLNVRTQTSVHLWLVVAWKEPLISPMLPTRDKAPRVHRLNFTFLSEYGLEQEEPGDSVAHTFRFNGVMPLGRLYYMLINVNPYKRALARTPIFVVDIGMTELARETWQPGPSGDWGWTLSYPANTSVLTATNSIVQNNESNINSASQGVDPSTIPGVGSLLPCNSYLAVDIGAAGAAFNKGYMALSVVQQRISPAYSLTGQLLVDGQTATGDRDVIPQDFPQPTTKAAISGHQLFMLGQLLQYPQNTPTSGTFPFDPTVPIVAINISCTNWSSIGGVQHSSGRWGQISLGTIAASAVRVDRTWRTLQNPVFRLFDLTP